MNSNKRKTPKEVVAEIMAEDQKLNRPAPGSQAEMDELKEQLKGAPKGPLQIAIRQRNSHSHAR